MSLHRNPFVMTVAGGKVVHRAAHIDIDLIAAMRDHVARGYQVWIRSKGDADRLFTIRMIDGVMTASYLDNSGNELSHTTTDWFSKLHSFINTTVT